MISKVTLARGWVPSPSLRKRYEAERLCQKIGRAMVLRDVLILVVMPRPKAGNTHKPFRSHLPGLDRREELPGVREEPAGEVPVQRIAHLLVLRVSQVPEVRAVRPEPLDIFDASGDRLPVRGVLRGRPAERGAPAGLVPHDVANGKNKSKSGELANESALTTYRGERADRAHRAGKRREGHRYGQQERAGERGLQHSTKPSCECSRRVHDSRVEDVRGCAVAEAKVVAGDTEPARARAVGRDLAVAGHRGVAEADRPPAEGTGARDIRVALAQELTVAAAAGPHRFVAFHAAEGLALDAASAGHLACEGDAAARC